MGEKVSEAPEPVPRGCSSHGARTLVPPAAAVSSEGASSAESSSGSETLSEEGEPGRFSCRSQPPRPPGGALGTRLPAAWAPARVALERGVPALPLPPPGGAVLPVPRVSSASQEEQDEEVGTAYPISNPPGLLCRGTSDSIACAPVFWRGEGELKAFCHQPGIVTVRRFFGSLTSCGWPRALFYRGYPTACFGNVAEPVPSYLYLLGLSASGRDLKAWLVPTNSDPISRSGSANS